MNRPLLAAFLALAACSATASAQNEAALRAALEGKTVTLKIEMPGTSKGIDLFPEEASPVNWRDVADRLKANSTSIRIGQTVMITKVVVNKNSHIEVQLGGGGYGTFGDETGTSVSISEEGETKAERALRDSVKTAATPAKKKQYEGSLNDLRNDRERKNSRLRAEAAQANEARDANLRVRRAEGGSRFNVRYKHGIPADAMTAKGVLAALAPYLELAGASSPSAATRPTTGLTGASGGGSALSLRKGLLISEVESLLGPANTATESREGRLTVMTRAYVSGGNHITATFVNGVLIDFAIAPQ